jgi:4-amino-4-deoxy-L-arabinose transferase-like glycosyltransferase
MDLAAEAAKGERTAAAGSAVTNAPSYSRHRIASLLVAVALTALALLPIVIITGGFLLQVGPLRLSAHNWHTPLVAGIAASVAAACLGRALLRQTAAAAWSFIDQHAVVFAVALAASTAGVGVGFGTYSASSSDASGYVSEAALISSARLSSDEPLARALAWRNATWAFSPLGYRPGTTPGELVPTYPAGLPLVMAPFRLVGGELAVYLVVPLLAAVAILATYFVGTRLHSRYAGLVAATLMATSPIVLFQTVQPMSDVPATAWWMVALLFALIPLPSAPLAAGGAAGLAILTRPNLLPLAIVIAMAAMNFPRPRWSASPASDQAQTFHERRLRPDRLVGFVAGITPAVGALLLMQWRLYGSPLASGYGPTNGLYSLDNVAPNVGGYVRRLISGETPALLLFTAAVLILAAVARREPSRWPLKRTVVLAAVAIAIVGGSYLPYAVFPEWSYLRFLLPCFPLLFIAIGALFSAALTRLPLSLRAALFLCALSVAGSFNILRADNEQAFNMRRYESRYRMAGRYLAAALPAKSVVIAVQESGSVRYYSSRSVLRWDWLDVDLDTAVAALRAIGFHPVFLVEGWERPDLIKRHQGSVTARLDWQPRAEFGDDTRVLLYDPFDRVNPPPWRPDRVH